MIYLLSLVIPVLGQTCPAGQVSIGGKCVTNDIKPLDSYVIYQQTETNVNMKFSFHFPSNTSQDQNVIMSLSVNQPGWFSIGLGNGMLTATDIWAFEVNAETGVVVAHDCFGLNYSGPSYDQNFGGENNLVVLGYEYQNNGVTTIKFKRLADTGDGYDQVLKQGKQSAMVAWGSGPTLKYHGHSNRDIFQFNFVEGENAIGEKKFSWWKIHLWINIIVWGMAVDVPIIIARYFKTNSWYINAHGFLMTLVIMVSLLAEIAMGYTNKPSFEYTNFQDKTYKSQLHLILGSMLTISIGLQIFGGWFLNFLISYNLKVTQNLPTMKTIHMVSGILIYLLGKLNVLFGAIISFPNTTTHYDVIIYTAYAVTIFWRLIAEYLYQRRHSIMFMLLRLSTKSSKIAVREPILSKLSITSNSKLLNHIEQLGKPPSQIYVEFKQISVEFPNKRWAIFNNSVIDLTKNTHPGGQFIWELVQGREISRFLYGAYSLEHLNGKPYKHSEYSIKLLEKLTIGKLVTIPLFSEELEDFNTWKIASRQSITSSIEMFELSRPNTTFSTQLNGIENFGRHFLLRSARNKTIACRPYTMVLCMAKPNQEYRSYLIQLISKELKLEANLLTEEIKEVRYQEAYNHFPLIIKRYNSATGFSQYIHSLYVNDEVELSGPYVIYNFISQGVSFGINSQEEGTIVIFAAGTGLLPFLDLLDFLLKRTMLTIAADRFPTLADTINPKKLPFGRYFKDPFKIQLFLAVESKQDLVILDNLFKVGSDIYLTLAKLQRFLSNPNFEIWVSAGFQLQTAGVCSVGKTRFDEEFINRNIRDIVDVKKFLICGPPSMNKAVPLSLQSLGVAQERIYLV